MTKEKVLENLNKLVGKKFDEDEIICSFEDYEEDGETDIVVSDSNNSGYDKIAYIGNNFIKGQRFNKGTDNGGTTFNKH